MYQHVPFENNSGTSDKRKITEKMLKLYGHVGRSKEGHAVRRMVDAPYQERDAEEDRKPDGKTLVKGTWKA